MFRSLIITTTIITAASISSFGYIGSDQYASQPPRAEGLVLSKQTLNGPRLGMSVALQDERFDGTGKANERRRENNIGSTISQFGWHFEWVVAPAEGGPAFVTEVLPFVGGVEYGTVIPSAAAVFGIRLPVGTEFGMGPQAVATFDKNQPVSTSLVMALGHSLSFGAVKIPLNVAFLTNRDGNTVSFVFGYAMPEVRRVQ